LSGIKLYLGVEIKAKEREGVVQSGEGKDLQITWIRVPILHAIGPHRVRPRFLQEQSPQS